MFRRAIQYIEDQEGITKPKETQLRKVKKTLEEDDKSQPKLHVLLKSLKLNLLMLTTV